MHSNNDLVSMDLSLDAFESIEAPMEDREAGFIVGVAFGLGIVIGAVIAT